MSSRAIQDNTSTATARRIFLLIYDDTTALAPWAGATTSVKAQLSANGGTENPSTNDIVRVGGALHYIELTQAEANRTEGDRIHARVAGASGRREAVGAADITADNIYAAASTPSVLSTTFLADLADGDGAAARAAIGEQAALTVIGAADLRYDDTTGSALTVVRKSTSATVATVPLRRGDRTQPIIGNG
jgi:hypothetical protein